MLGSRVDVDLFSTRIALWHEIFWEASLLSQELKFVSIHRQRMYRKKEKKKLLVMTHLVWSRSIVASVCREEAASIGTKSQLSSISSTYVFMNNIFW